MNRTNMNKPVMRLTLSGIMIALGTVLSLFTIIKMPQGGTITPLSMLPVIIIGYIYGVKWGCFTGLAYGIIQMLIGGDIFANSFWVAIGSILLDYLLAFGAMGFGGLFRNIIKVRTVSLGLGSSYSLFSKIYMSYYFRSTFIRRICCPRTNAFSVFYYI